ncbi:MAG TPA: NADP-specific glutamate dehydrogenase [Acidobacteriota bacterium]|nr:NADP-specific glutamate dehydrogenase [Acidobacteriota bacterium]
MDLDSFLKRVRERNPGETEFHQAVEEVAATLADFIEKRPKYEKGRVLERLTEPDRIIIFRVCWEDDEGNVRINRGYRVQFNNAIGPYKGGLRFHPSVNLSILKFLGFEQVFKNALTTLPMGGAKGGSDFNPRGRSDREVMRFCHAFMSELYRHIGKDADVPAGDIGVGAREVSYLFGQYKRLTNEWTGTITGKGLDFGGSPVRTEATGYGCVYFVQNMLKRNDDSLAGKTCLISGSGNVAQYTAEKLIDLGARAVTLSDSDGFIHDAEGLTREKLDWVKELKNERRGRIREYAEEFGVDYFPGEKPWVKIPCDVAFPSATQNEILKQDALALVENGCIAVGEGANMPSNADAVEVFLEGRLLYGPSKAANAGGVAISGLEMTQNSIRQTWTREQVDRRLQEIMHDIHEKCVKYGLGEDGYVNYPKGANVAAFRKVGDTLLAYGIL